MSSYFPKIILPDSLKEFYKDWKSNIDIYLEPSKPIEPIKPEEPEPVKFEIVAVLGTYFFIGMIMLPFTKKVLYEVLGFCTWTFIYTIYYFSSLRQYRITKKKFELEYTSYERSVAIYKNQIVEYLKQLDEIKEFKKDLQWLEKRRLETTNTLMTVLKKPIFDYNSRKGSSEKQFESILHKYFGELIVIDKTTEIFSYYQKEDSNYDFDYWNSSENKSDNAYVPDFTFIHDKSNMMIDIEIDEPYTYDRPIHVEGNTRDNTRNEYFTSINWFVMRFSERQILKHPESCCKEIALLIKDYTGDATFLNLIEINQEVPRDKMWNFDTAKEYSLQGVRKNYSMLSNISVDETLVIGEWLNNSKKYLINANNIIVEIDTLTNNNTDSGTFSLRTYPCGRLVMSVKWQRKQTKYILNRGWNQDLILTDLYNRDQVTFWHN